MSGRKTKRARPAPELLKSLYAGKRALHAKHRGLTPREKVALVLALQRIGHPLRAKKRNLASWEHPWDVDP